ncbi:MAG TPA: RsmD family RNA methyltransferase, partial [Lysobacter sp.]
GALRDTVARLAAQDAVAVVHGDALAWLAQQPAAAFDIAFVDPPFAAGLWEAVLAQLPARMRANGWVYVEAPHEAEVSMPAGWTLHREGRTRDVRYALLRALPQGEGG